MAKRAREDEIDPYRADISTTSPSLSTPHPDPAPAITSPHPKIAHVSNDTNEALMTCSLPGHAPMTFGSYGAYETHYTQAHTNRCHECRRNFPSAHILALHISERHDSMVAVLRDRGEKTYGCFVEGCEKKCATPAKRKAHLVAKHAFPENYDFAVTKEGIDGKTSLLRAERRGKGRGGRREGGLERREKRADEADDAKDEEMKDGGVNVEATSEAASEQQEVKIEKTKDVDMDDLAGAMSSLRFIPQSVRFGRGRGKGRGGFSRT